ncbi:hypothetical protein PISMIDRAFT_43950, partial [Pisolithus microcarpus 441]
SSVQSNHSLHSQGPADLSDVEKSNPRKIPAKWTEEEEHALVLFLQANAAAAGDGLNFSKRYFNSTSQHLKDKFPNQRGGEKTGNMCSSKWTSLQEEYFAVVDLKKALGLTWTDENGAGMSSHDIVWKEYVKTHRHAACFRNKGFHLFQLLEEMMPSHAKGSYVF